ncbi:DUF1116 domain-containing protein [Oceanimonas sp. CHS3-5]|uniref:oxamate carbamoyltransferase subunit AllG family protein n=1 Tax=Oceanimonas sp. CHS3-5 TaxID=3068186 RepID=UPI00273F984D|nr:DUF1116 domain-containing protein [Oceanimonas sp. CHS3-5]MDP5291822.1 DUF1116 domain-containing protein [Oceanimonas sp. CHS3-5]
MSLATADRLAFERVKACRPQWSGFCLVRDLVGSGRILLHAGPPFESREHIPAPVMNSLCTGAVWEGWASDEAQARRMILNHEIELRPAQDNAIVVPLAGVVSPSMSLLVVQDGNRPEACRFSVLNEGMVHCTRLGRRDPLLPAHLSWLNEDLAEWLKERLQQPLALLPLMRAALADGDDCHGRTLAGSALIHQQLTAMASEQVPADIDAFLQNSPAFALNLWMAACSLMLAAAEGVSGASLVTRAGGNGVTFGIQLATAPGRWITMPAPPIHGLVEPAHTGRTALGALGDSAVVDFAGLGGQVLNTAHASRQALAPVLPADALTRPAQVLAGPLPELDDRPAVTSARCVTTNGGGPLVLLGMIEETGEAGRIGGGVADVPVTLFEQALREVMK